jgi:hypothetical protein
MKDHQMNHSKQIISLEEEQMLLINVLTEDCALSSRILELHYEQKAMKDKQNDKKTVQ